MKKRLAIGLLMGALLAALPGAAAAAGPSNPSCWGAAVRDLAQTYAGAMGDHASSFDSPRLGIGNVAYLFTGTHQPGDLAAALGFTCN